MHILLEYFPQTYKTLPSSCLKVRLGSYLHSHVPPLTWKMNLTGHQLNHVNTKGTSNSCQLDYWWPTYD